jgi:hypothetical protein
MVDLAKLVVKLEAETSKYTAELEKANKKLAGFQQSSNKIFAGLRTGIAGFIAGVSFGKIIQETSAAQAALAKLDNAVKNNAGAAGTSTKELANLSKELQRLTTFSDESVQEMQALLLTFRQIRGPEFAQAQTAVLDLATALGKDLNSSALLVGRALADPVKGMSALARAGVVLSASQKALIKDLAETGRLSEAQGLILKGLESRFGGAARAARDTLGGAITGLKNAFGDLLEAESNVSDLTGSINELSNVLSDPKTKEAVDSLFGLIISGVSRAIEEVVRLTNFIADIGANADKSPLFRWTRDAAKEFGFIGSEVEKLEDQIQFLTEASESFAPGILVLGNQPFKPDSILGVLSKDDIKKRLQELNLEAARLRNQVSKSSGPVRRTGGPRFDDEPTPPTKEYLAAKEALENLLMTTRQQAKALDESAEATMRYRLTQGDLLKEMKLLGAEGDKLAAQLISASRALDVSKAIKDLENFNTSLTTQTEGLDDNAAAAVRYRLEIGDLADEVKRAGEEGQKLKIKIIDAADAKQQKEDLKDIATGLQEINSQIAELQGDSASGALLNFDKQNAELIRKATRQGDEAALAKIKQLRDMTQAQAEYNALQVDAQRIQSELDRQEQRISNAQQIGAMSDMESLNELSSAREKAVEQLRQIEEQMRAIAAASGNPELVENTKAFTQEIDNLAAQTDLVAQKIRESGEDAFADFAVTAIRDIRSIGDAVGKLLDDIANQLIEMSARQLFQQIFATGTTGGGWIEAAAGFFTGGGSGGGAKAAGGGSRDSGGRGKPGTTYAIGVRAQPELFVPDQPGKFLPRDQWMPKAAQTVQQNFYIEAPQGTVSRQTQMQIGASASKSLQTANRRNN